MLGNNPAVTHYAILIGVGFFEVKISKGAVNDVEGIKTELPKGREPGSVEIHAFTSSVDSTGRSGAQQDPLHMPSFDNIADTFCDIVSRAQPGHYLYFHFSGHGATIPPQKTNNRYTANLQHIVSSEDYPSTESTADLALIVLEGNSGFRPRYLRGLELAGLLKRAVDKGLILTVVLDCCFSGSVVRSDQSARFAPYDPEIDIRYPLRPDIALKPEGRATYPVFRGSTVAWLVNPKEYCILAACGPDGIADELRFEQGNYHGALSYHLVRQFQSFGRVGGRQHHIYANVCAKFRHRGSKQKPMLFGNKHLGFFESFHSKFYANPVPVYVREGKFLLEAGEAHGICRGDYFAVVDPAEYTTSLDIKQRIGAFQVSDLGPTTSELSVLNGASPNYRSGMIVTACTTFSLRKIPIHLCVDDNAAQKIWDDVLQKRPSLNVTIGTCEPEAPFSFYFTILDNDHYQVRDASKTMLDDVPQTSLDLEAGVSFVFDLMEHLARFEMIKDLSNDNPRSDFLDSFEIDIQNQSKTQISRGRCREGALLCSHDECAVRVGDDERVIITVKNKAEKRDRKLYLHLFDLAAFWEVDNLVAGNPRPIPGRNGRQTRRIRMEVPEKLRERGLTECENIIKAFVTTRPVSFLSLAMPAIDELSGKAQQKFKRGNPPPEVADDWATFNFRICTSLS